MARFTGINFLGQHSRKDHGLTISSRDISHPNKIKVKQTLPFSNQTYDFSELYGSQVFEERTLTYTFDIMDPRNIDTNWKLNTIKTKVVNWLSNSRGKQKLYDDVYPNYYFLAEVEDGADFEENWTHGTLSVTFTAYPFMSRERPEGHDIWDEFNFELDVAQFTTFDVSGSQSITLINNGTPDVVPQIISDAHMTIIHDGYSYNVNPGTSKDLDFVLSPGTNRMTIRGNGRIEFLYHQELI
jgi:phage-related protein